MYVQNKALPAAELLRATEWRARHAHISNRFATKDQAGVYPLAFGFALLKEAGGFPSSWSTYQAYTLREMSLRKPGREAIE